MSYGMPRRRRSSTISALLRSANSRGGIPCLSASYVIGVPCSSVPLAMSTREPRSRSKRARTSAGTAKPATWPMCRGPFAYGHAGAMRTVRPSGLRAATDDERNLTADLLAESGGDLARGAAQDLLVELRQLAGERHRPVRQHLVDQGKRFPSPVRRLEGDRGPRIVDQRP